MAADEGGDRGTADIVGRFMRSGFPGPRQLVLEGGKDLNEVWMAFMKGGIQA
ncbi:MAG: hypothetical protein NTV79_02745 [Candidatus Aureabacteria bacterium]|nr:hypothetical protein [Candidatus Auribacterota bacterium]